MYFLNITMLHGHCPNFMELPKYIVEVFCKWYNFFTNYVLCMDTLLILFMQVCYAMLLSSLACNIYAILDAKLKRKKKQMRKGSRKIYIMFNPFGKIHVARVE